MKKLNWLKIRVALGVIIMLVAFAVVPDEYPDYYKLLLFNVGLFLWLLTKREIKRLEKSIDS